MGYGIGSYKAGFFSVTVLDEIAFLCAKREEQTSSLSTEMREATDRGRCALAAKLWFGRLRGYSGTARVAHKPKIFQSPHAAPHDYTRGHWQRRLLCDLHSTHLWIALQPRKWTASISIDRITNFYYWLKHWTDIYRNEQNIYSERKKYVFKISAKMFIKVSF